MKTFAAIALAGVTGLALLKLITALILPFFGVLLGLVVLVAKVALVAAVGFFAFSMIRKRCGRAAA